MIINFAMGKIIVTAHEIVVRLDGDNRCMMQVNSDAVTLIGGGANVITANDNDVKWSIKLDNEQQLTEISDQLCLPIQ